MRTYYMDGIHINRHFKGEMWKLIDGVSHNIFASYPQETYTIMLNYSNYIPIFLLEDEE